MKYSCCDKRLTSSPSDEQDLIRRGLVTSLFLPNYRKLKIKLQKNKRKLKERSKKNQENSRKTKDKNKKKLKEKKTPE